MGVVGDPMQVLATADPPAHTRHRKLLQSHFSPAALAGLEAVLCDIVDEQIAPVIAAGRGEVVSGLSNTLPARVICHVVGIAQEHAMFVMDRVAATAPLMDGVADLDGMVAAGAAALELMEFTARVGERAARRRAVPVSLPLEHNRSRPRRDAHPGQQPRPVDVGRGKPPVTR
jgi:cytochrome P450